MWIETAQALFLQPISEGAGDQLVPTVNQIRT